MRKLTLWICLMLIVSVIAGTDSLVLLQQLRCERLNIVSSLGAIETELQTLKEQLQALRRENELQRSLLLERKTDLEQQKRLLAEQKAELETREKRLAEWEISSTDLRQSFDDYRKTAETRVATAEARGRRGIRWGLGLGAAGTLAVLGLVKAALR